MYLEYTLEVDITLSLLYLKCVKEGLAGLYVRLEVSTKRKLIFFDALFPAIKNFCLVPFSSFCKTVKKSTKSENYYLP